MIFENIMSLFYKKLCVIMANFMKYLHFSYILLELQLSEINLSFSCLILRNFYRKCYKGRILTSTYICLYKL